MLETLNHLIATCISVCAHVAFDAVCDNAPQALAAHAALLPLAPQR
jgi:hypothetical protein